MNSAASLATFLIDRMGAVGIALGVMFNGMGLPGLSEVLLPLGGVAVRQGYINGPLLVVLAWLGQLIGVSIAYAIARAGGLPLIERYGRYILVSQHDLSAARKAFDRYGGRMILIGSFTPGVQGFVGYAAGVSEMKFGWFIVSAAVGKFVWVSALVYLGWVLGNHMAFISHIISDFGIVILLAIIVLAAWYIWHNRSSLDKQAPHHGKGPNKL